MCIKVYQKSRKIPASTVYYLGMKCGVSSDIKVRPPRFLTLNHGYACPQKRATSQSFFALDCWMSGLTKKACIFHQSNNPFKMLDEWIKNACFPHSINPTIQSSKIQSSLKR